MNSKSAPNQYGSLDTFMKHTVCVQQSKITQTTQNLQTNTHNSKPDANPKFDHNHILLPNQFKLQPDSSFITSPNRVPSPSVPSPTDSGISLQSPGSDTSETQKHARDSETCPELLKTEKHASTFRVPQLPNKIRASDTCDLCKNQCICQSTERRIEFHPQSCQDDPRLRIRKFVEKRNSMMKQIKPSIYSAKARLPVIPKLHRMTLQKLRTMKREQLKNQLKFQQESSRAQDFTYQAEFYQQEKTEVEHNVRISQRKMKNLNAQNVPVQSVLIENMSDHENITVQNTSSQNSDNQNSVQNSETHKTHENYNSTSPTCDSTINQFKNNLIQQQADTNNYF